MHTILVVDDEVRIRKVYRQLLEQRGYKVLTALDAVRAREILNEQPVDLVLLDIKMREVSGDELYEITQTFHSNVQVIVSSVYPQDEQKRRIEGAVDYYDKSESIQTLLGKIERVLSPGRPTNVRKRVLVVDDEPKTRELFHAFLEGAGYESVELGDSFSVFKFLKQQIDQIDLIILDLAMPRIDGIDFFEIIRNKYPGAKILISSNFPVPEQRFQVFDADDYFDKSEGKDALLVKVRQLITV
jgi:CheY-like chemotaxis protein